MREYSIWGGHDRNFGRNMEGVEPTFIAEFDSLREASNALYWYRRWDPNLLAWIRDEGGRVIEGIVAIPKGAMTNAGEIEAIIRLSKSSRVAIFGVGKDWRSTIVVDNGAIIEFNQYQPLFYPEGTTGPYTPSYFLADYNIPPNNYNNNFLFLNEEDADSYERGFRG